MVNENLGNAIEITPVGFLRKVEGGKALVRLQFRPDLMSVFLPSFSSRIFPFFFITSDRPFLSERPVLKIGPYKLRPLFTKNRLSPRYTKETTNSSTRRLMA